jgi:hypothetical protein
MFEDERKIESDIETSFDPEDEDIIPNKIDWRPRTLSHWRAPTTVVVLCATAHTCNIKSLNILTLLVYQKLFRFTVSVELKKNLSKLVGLSQPLRLSR